jgi:hypothetical protein
MIGMKRLHLTWRKPCVAQPNRRTAQGKNCHVKITILIASVAVVSACSAVPNAPDAGSSPLAFNAPPGDGYSIALLKVDPVPGTALVAGAKLNFKVTVSYKMSISSHGDIFLVFQDEKDVGIKPDDPRAKFEVTQTEGVASLANAITVPSGAKEVRVFVPIMPEGLKSTTGEVTIRYPIKQTKL